jgi:exodeoxyribonuclease VII small subunit
MAKPSSRSGPSASPPEPAAHDEDSGVGTGSRGATGNGGASALSFREAQTALELCLAQLQDQDLDVEAMADLYQRALAYAERCEAVLARVEQQVMQWDPGQPDLAPTPYTP